MSDDLDPTSKVCLTCQQNGLRPSFSDEPSDDPRFFKVRLIIKTDPGGQRLFVYVGYSTSKKGAKKEAALAALRDSKFRQRVPDSVRPGYRKSEAKKPTSRKKPVNRTYYGSADENQVSGNAYPTGSRPPLLNQPPNQPSNQPLSQPPNQPLNQPTIERVRSSATAPNRPNPAVLSLAIPGSDTTSTTPGDSVSRNSIVSLYFKAKRHQRPTKIKFVVMHQDEMVVKISVGDESKAAQGKDDLEAIEKAAKQFKLDLDGAKEEDASIFESDGIDYYNILNQIHLKTRLEFKSSCLLSSEEEHRSLYLWKCQLGEFISYGLDESIVFSQNAAAYDILIKLRNGLNNEIDELTKQRDVIEDKLNSKQFLVDLINDEMTRLASSCKEFEHEFKHENEFDPSPEEADDKMYHDL